MTKSSFSFRNHTTSTLVAFMVALAGVATAADTIAIKGRFTGKSTVTPLSETELIFRQENVGAGHISHLGSATAEWVVREVRFDSTYAQLVVPQPEWTGTITTARGDKIFGTYTFRSTTLPISASGDVTFITDLVVTGGTGRFANATGYAEAFGRGNIWTRKFEIQMEGELSGVKRSRR